MDKFPETHNLPNYEVEAENLNQLITSKETEPVIKPSQQANIQDGLWVYIHSLFSNYSFQLRSTLKAKRVFHKSGLYFTMKESN